MPPSSSEWGERFGRRFDIRDFSFDGDRSWRVSPPRPFYFPVLFMAPERSDAREVIGYDVHDDARFRSAIERSGLLEEPVATLPFDLVEGGRGYIYLRALKPGGRGETAGVSEHLISLLIRADRFFTGALTPAGAWLALRHRDAQEPAAALIGAVGDAPAPAASNDWSLPLPALHLRRALPSTYQPFELELIAHPKWRGFAWISWSLWLCGWSLLVWGGWALRRSHRLRKQALRQTALAQQDLASAEQRAEASRTRGLDELSSGIAHELNQPLTAMVSYSQAALRLLRSSAIPSTHLLQTVRETLEANAQQALRAGELMQRLRLLVRKQPVQLRPLVLQDVVATGLRLERTRIEAGKVNIDTHMPTDGVGLLGDALLLEQMLTNLLRNAVEALDVVPPGERHITIELRVEALCCRLEVRDNGPGMTAEQLARVFHPFQSTKAGGVGIGLVVCATIARAHGGEISAESVGSGGARFAITLPLASAIVAPSDRESLV